MRGGEGDGRGAGREGGEFAEELRFDVRGAGEAVENGAEGGGGCVGAGEAGNLVRWTSDVKRRG